MTQCISCGTEFPLKEVYYDELGRHTVCPHCKASFDTMDPMDIPSDEMDFIYATVQAKMLTDKAVEMSKQLGYQFIGPYLQYAINNFAKYRDDTVPDTTNWDNAFKLCIDTYVAKYQVEICLVLGWENGTYKLERDFTNFQFAKDAANKAKNLFEAAHWFPNPIPDDYPLEKIPNRIKKVIINCIGEDGELFATYTMEEGK